MRARNDATESFVYLSPIRAAVLAFFLGGAFLIGGPDRISGPSYLTVRAYGGEVTWGLGFLGLAMILMLAWQRSQRVLFWAYMAGAAAYALFALAVIDAARQLDTAGLTGIVVYAWVTWIHTMAAAAIGKGKFADRIAALFPHRGR